MAITKIDFPTASTPSYTPSISTDYNSQNEYIERNARGYNAVSLTNWDATTTAPQVAAGSVLEINGSSWDITTDTSIATTDASSGVNYLVFDDAGAGFGWNDTAPTWSATLNGWYVAGDRFTGHLCTWDGASSYSVKLRYHTDKQDGADILISPGGNINLDAINATNATGWGGVYGTQAVGASSEWIIPAGVYMLVVVGANMSLAIKDTGSTWISGLGYPAGLCASDGTNYKITNGVGSGTVYYRKIW